MPGRNEPLQAALEAIHNLGIEHVISLAPLAQIWERSPEYARLIEAGATPWQQDVFPVQDFGVPQDEDAYWAFFQRVSERVRAGEKLLLHCAAGIGRTGMGAITLLMCLGVERQTAVETVRRAGSGPEEPPQFALLERLERRMAKQPTAHSRGADAR
jgi:atypical dual specificity phosphatase